MPIAINDQVSIPDEACEERFVRSSGPGGQNVNKVATAVQLRIDLEAAGLDPAVDQRLRRLAGSQVDQRGILHVHAQTARTRERNRTLARERVAEMVRRALVVPKRRRRTAPTRASERRRLEAKRQTALRKRSRSRVEPHD